MLIAILFMPLTLSLFLFEKSISKFFILYVVESDLKKLIIIDEKLNIKDFQQARYNKSAKILFFIVLWPILRFDFYYLILILSLTIFTYKYPYLKLKRSFKKDISLVKYQFPIWLRQIQILLHNNNVINSLIISKPQAPSIIKSELESLIVELEKNPNNVEVFSSFMDKFNISEVNRAMKLLYRCYLVDKKESSKQLNRMIVTTTKWLRRERLSRQEDSLSIYEWIGILPLFGVTIIFLVLLTILITNIFGKGVSV